MPSTLIYADLSNAKPCKNAGGTSYSFSPFIAGGELDFVFRFLDYSTGSAAQIYPAVSAIRAAIGYLDARPTSGQFKIKVGTAAQSDANTTAFINFNATALQVANALNALSASTYNCVSVDGSLLISRVDNVATVFAVVSNTLSPVSFGTINALPLGSDYVYDLRLIQSPLAFSDSATSVEPLPPVIAIVTHGGSSASFVWDTVQSLNVPLNFAGTYQLSYGLVSSVELDVTSNTSDIANAINGMLPSGSFCKVTNPTTGFAYINFGGDLAGNDVAALIVTVHSAPPADNAIQINLGLAEMRAALRSVSSILVPFEVEADFYIDPTNHSLGTETVKLWSVNVTINKPLIFPELATISAIDWLHHKAPADYLVYGSDNTVTGQQSYTTPLGNGAATIFAIAHNLACPVPSSIIVRENTAGGRVLELGADYQVNLTSSNALSLSGFAAVPTFNQYVVCVTCPQIVSAFASGLTVTQSQVVGLSTIIAGLSSQLAYLMSLIPKAGVISLLSGQPDAVSTIPPIGELLPDLNSLDAVLSLTSQLVNNPNNPNVPIIIFGTPLDNQSQKDATALKQATNDKVSAASVAPSAIQSIPFSTIPEVIGWRQAIPSIGNTGFLDSQFIGSAPSLLSSSKFDRELWRVAFNSNLLSAGRKVQLDWGIALQSIKSNCLSEYKAVLEVGTYADPSSVLAITWNSNPIYILNLAITKELAVHSFGAVLKNDAGVISLSYQLYGTPNAAASIISTPNAVLRCRLINLETDQDAPRGYIYYSLVPSNTPAAGVSQAGAKVLQN